MEHVDHRAEAGALFDRFAARHGLRFQVVPDAPVDLLWEFPVQDRLSLPMSLGLQNSDELTFGVPGFWSYFFPLAREAPAFERIIDAWVTGAARIAVLPGRARFLEMRNPDGTWVVAYRANPPLFRSAKPPRAFLFNAGGAVGTP